MLEIMLDHGPAPAIIGRFWIDPLFAVPTHQTRVEMTTLTDAWIERLLLDFVEKALR